MKKIELLAPAGNFNCLVAAIEAGCDAVYLAGENFGARAFAKNFTNLEIVEAINYAHLYGVKVYVTVNTLIYDDEVDAFLEYVEFLHKNNVDALIIQDLGMFDLVRKTYPNLELHGSTQMHIHNIDGVKMVESLGMKRVVLARETSIDKIIEIKKNTDIELEVFIHGALCISYSGECLMSSLIGGRSGNRGACAQSCRLKYDIVDSNEKKLNKLEYPLSTKDLNCLENIGELIDVGVSSLKIEGRMKSREYVYMVVKLYREAIDSYYELGKVIIDKRELLKLKKTFNREYTKGFIFNDTNIINGYRPNHMGVEIGTVVKYKDNYMWIKLNDKISIGSGLRVIGRHDDVGVLVNDFYINDKLVKEANSGDTVKMRVNTIVNEGDKVVITLDKRLEDEIDLNIRNEKRKVEIRGVFCGYIGNSLSLEISDGVNNVKVFGGEVNLAINTPTSNNDIRDKLNKLGDTVYCFSNLKINVDNDVFIPLKEINKLRQEAIRLLNNKRLYKTSFMKNKYDIEVPDFKKEKLTNCLISNKCKFNNLDNHYDDIYCEEMAANTILKLPRVIDKYPDSNDIVMIGELGGFNKYKEVITDFSLNVTNSYTVAFLHSIGAKRITLSYELNDNQIKNLIDNYHKRYGKHPNLELIVSGYEEVMVSKYSLNYEYNNNNIYLRDRFGNKFKIRTKNGIMYIYNYSKRQMNGNYFDMGINSIRINMDI